jgi:hypothetical protein
MELVRAEMLVVVRVRGKKVVAPASPLLPAKAQEMSALGAAVA